MTEVHIHYAHTTGKLRVYDQQNGYTDRLEYAAIIEALWISQSMVQLQAAKGDINKRAILAIFGKLFGMGAERVLIQRAKGRRMPYGTLIESGEHEDTYLVNLLELNYRGLLNA